MPTTTEMPFYVGVKVIQARPMSRRKFLKHKRWDAENDDQPGYLVRYADGYESWSPAKTFEEAYFEMGSKDVAEDMAERAKTRLRDE